MIGLLTRGATDEHIETMRLMGRMWEDYARLEEDLWVDPDDEPLAVRAAHEEFIAVRRTLPRRLQLAWWLSGGGW
jgi:hypothetical protein